MDQKRARAVPGRRAPRVLVADDHQIILDSLPNALTKRGFRVVAVAKNGRRAVLLARQFHPDVAVLDVTMPVMGGLDAARLILRALPRTAVVFLTSHAEDYVVFEGLRIGVRGFVVKAQGLDDLIQAIRDVSHGAMYVSAVYSRSVLEAFATGAVSAGPGLTPREVQTLRLIAEGKTTKGAAAVMAISSRTAESHRAHLKRKLQIHHTAGLVCYAIRQGLFRP